MRVLITGGAGFIGSHLADTYLERGDDVYIIDDLSTGTLENIKHLQGDERYKDRLFVSVDSVLNRDKMLELVGICDIVYHMAAAVGVQYILENPLSSIVTNLCGTELVLELCNKFRKKVLIASTSEVYGKQTHAPLLETDNCLYGPSTKSRWSYAAAKLMDEFTALAYHRKRKLDVIIVRFFNTVGPRQTGRYGMVLPRFVKKALANEPIPVYGDGSQTRTFTHVLDVTKSIVQLMEIPEAIGQVINIGGMEEVSILDLSRRVIQATKSVSGTKFVSYDEAFPRDFEDIQRRVPSTKKLKLLTGSAPSRGLNEIIDDVVDYYQNSPQLDA